MKFFKFTGALLIASVLVTQFAPITALAATGITITQGTGGTAISSTTAGGTYTSISGPTLTETVTGSIGGNGSTPLTLELNAPTGFEFNPASSVTASVPDTCSGNQETNLNSGGSKFTQVVTPTASKITVTVAQPSTNSCLTTLNFSGIQVRPTATSTFVGGYVTLSGTSMPSGAGDNLIPLNIQAGAASQMVMAISPTGAIQAPGSVTLTLTVKDANGIPVANGTAVDLSASFGILSGDTTTTNGIAVKTLTASSTGTSTLSSGLTLIASSTEVAFIDTVAPSLSLAGSSPFDVWISTSTSYVDPGASSTDAVDGDLTANIQSTSTVDIATLGTYTVDYSVSDAAGNTSTAQRIVKVINKFQPLITLLGFSSTTTEAGLPYVDAGATAVDRMDVDITGMIVYGVNGTTTIGAIINTAILGGNIITYDVTDSDTIAASQVTRTVSVVDTTAPVITLNGPQQVTINTGDIYTDAGATSTDSFDPSPTLNSTSTVNTAIPGEYTVTYTSTDSSGNEAEPVVRNVIVELYETPTLTIVKKTIGGDGTFNFTISGSTSTSTAITTTEGTGSVTLNMNEGTSTISELTNLGWYIQSVACLYDGESVGQSVEGGEEISVDNGDDVTCTFINATATSTGSIRVVKNVVGTDGETNVEDTHSFQAILNGTSTLSVAEGSDALFTDLLPGTYTITEATSTDYDLVSISPDNNSEALGTQVSVLAGTTTVVTITNKQKVATPTNGGDSQLNPQAPTGGSTPPNGGGNQTGGSTGTTTNPVFGNTGTTGSGSTGSNTGGGTGQTGGSTFQGSDTTLGGGGSTGTSTEEIASASSTATTSDEEVNATSSNQLAAVASIFSDGSFWMWLLGILLLLLAIYFGYRYSRRNN